MAATQLRTHPFTFLIAAMLMDLGARHSSGGRGALTPELCFKIHALAQLSGPKDGLHGARGTQG
jgi:hypothetical protein